MARLQSEDPDALDVLFSRHSRLVFSIAFRILHDAGEAEEVVQDSFLYVYRKALSFEPSKGSAKVWIIQVAYSRARDRKARLLRRGFYLRTDIESVGLSDTLVGQPDIEREIDAKIEFDRLQCAFEDLTEIQRETLKLFYRGIYLTPPTPRCSVWGHGRGLSEDVAGVGAAFLHRGILC
jgi:RNA polymerase sigma-70 factor (ECF subfamily)